MSTDLAPAPTADDHRDQRRSDVLAAAEALLHERGCDAFSMREVAARAGVSAGATYQWFKGKDEILCQLYVDRLEIGLARIEALPPGMGLEELIHQIFVWHRPLWRDLGAWAIDFVDATPPAGDSYYRLRPVDLDGSFTRGPIRKVTLPREIGLTVTPNPSQGEAFARLPTDHSNVEWTLHDVTGRQILRMTGGSEWRLHNLAPGSYLLTATDRKARYTQRLIVK